MKPAKFEYESAETVEEAVKLLGAADGFAKPLAGGQSLGPMMNLRLAQPDLLVDIRRIEELGHVEQRNGGLFVGAGVVHSAIEDGTLPDATNGFLPFVAGQIAYRAVRNRGTIGGSVAHADPAGDWPTALLVLGASVVIAGAGGRRTVALEDFQIGAFTVALEPEEVVCGIEIPALSASARWGHYKVCRKPGEFADSIGTVVVDPDRGFARAVLGATDGAPLMLPAVAERLRASGADGFGVEDAKQAIADAGVSFDSYLTQIHAVALSRAAKGAFAS
jgi:carbon-monoxide dehydrogenase medium subunit